MDFLPETVRLVVDGRDGQRKIMTFSHARVAVERQIYGVRASMMMGGQVIHSPLMDEYLITVVPDNRHDVSLVEENVQYERVVETEVPLPERRIILT